MAGVLWNTWRQMTTSLPHLPLQDNRSIRLIQLIPDPRQPAGFWISLQNYALDEAPPFEVLSYTRVQKYFGKVIDEWEKASGHFCTDFSAYPKTQQNGREGSLVNRLQNVFLDTMSVASTEIKTNHSVLAIHHDVLAFLKHANKLQMYRPRDLTSAGLDNKSEFKADEILLWVDRICIAQKDDAERGEQVSLLGDIYKRARRTVVWLSEHEPPESVDWIFREFVPQYSRINDEKRIVNMWKNDPLGQGKLMEQLLGKGYAVKWVAAMLHLWSLVARHQYFGEGWMQEVLLSSQVELMCGSKVWDWMTLERLVLVSEPAIGAIVGHKVGASNPLLRKHWQYVVSVMKDYNLIRTWWIEGSLGKRREDMVSRMGPLQGQEFEYCQLARMAWMHKGKVFGDRRDSIYGWLALTSLALPGGKRFGKPDYTMSPASIYQRFAASLLKGMPTLDVLNYVEVASARKTANPLPSWVPDFSAKLLPRPMLNGEPNAFGLLFDATATRNLRRLPRTLEIHQDTLVVSGVRIDLIQNRGPGFDLNQALGKVRSEWFLERCLEMKSHLHTNQTVQEALCDTLTLGGASMENPADWVKFWESVFAQRRKTLSPEEDAKLSQLLEKVNKHSSGKNRFPYTVNPLEKEGGARCNQTAKVAQTTRLLDKIILILMCRAPYVSKQGCWGVCHSSAAAGDEIWLLDGGRTPYVLRKIEQGRQYQLMGETYLHGYMFGEHLTPELYAQRQDIRIV